MAMRFGAALGLNLLSKTMMLSIASLLARKLEAHCS
jgi:hypothetical protein